MQPVVCIVIVGVALCATSAIIIGTVLGAYKYAVSPTSSSTTANGLIIVNPTSIASVTSSAAASSPASPAAASSPASPAASSSLASPAAASSPASPASSSPPASSPASSSSRAASSSPASPTASSSRAASSTTLACNNLFLGQITYSTGASSVPYSVAVADVNGDSKLDIVVANYGGNNVAVLLNAGTGTFLAPVTYSTGASSAPYSLAVADVNGDSKPDIVVAEKGTNSVGVLLNAGSGTFLGQTTYSTGNGSVPYSVAVADVNNDNQPDIVVAEKGTNSVGVLLNAGSGTFLGPTTYSTGNGSVPYSVAVVDVNNDNQPDIIVANQGSNTVGVLLNAGSGTFLTQTTYSTGTNSHPSSVAVVDINSDNKPDIVVVNTGSGTVGVLLNSANGVFLAQTTYSTGNSSYSYAVAVADVNSDNQPDIVITNLGPKNVGIFLNAGNGMFLTQTTYSTGTGSYPYSVAIADINGDNKPDMVVANEGLNNVGVFLHC